MPLRFDTTYAQLPERLYARVQPTAVPSPRLLALVDEVAALLGTTAEELRAPETVAMLAGNAVPDGVQPLALAYAGHQFGSFVPQLGDGRALLLGEVVGVDGVRYDVQLKGAGRTPYSRGGDGRAALGPVLRELVVSEAMFALGVPTTRALAAVATGAPVLRESALPGAVLTRVATSHLRVGTFQFAAARRDVEGLRALLEFALARHYPARAAEGALGLLDAVAGAQAQLVAKWLALGFVHGVMNTDNSSISGETLDYGPCAFLDAYDPGRTFSSIDHHGRYAFANQPRMALWNLARLAEALLPLVEGDDEGAAAAATTVLERFPARFDTAYGDALRAKLGLATAREDDLELARALLDAMAEQRADFTLVFRRLCDVADDGDAAPWLALFADPTAARTWLGRWRARVEGEPRSARERAAAMRRVNPAFIPRNHRIEAMIAAATDGDLAPLQRLRRVLGRPYDEQPDDAELAAPPGDEQWAYRTFCGT